MKQHASKKTNIWFVGGGTGGHIMPLLAVAEQFKHDASVVITYIGQSGGKEESLAHQAGLPFKAIPYGKLRRYLTVSSFFLNIRDTFRSIAGIVTSVSLIKKHRPDLIFSKGGPVALPLALAARWEHVPLITHESDIAIGASNRIIARFADRVLTGFPAQHYPASMVSKVTMVGIPLRGEFCRQTKSTKHHSRPMVLITGGIQGALAINQAIAAILPELLKEADVMHITGDYSFDQFRSVKEHLPKDLAEHYGVIPFTPVIADYMREASLIVTRASSTIFEAAALQKPMLLIPLPTAANNHQVKNAEIFVKHNAARMLIQDNLTPNLLYETISSLLKDKSLRAELREGMLTFNSCGAAKYVAQILKEHAQR